jgi:hypothetical protein
MHVVFAIAIRALAPQAEPWRDNARMPTPGPAGPPAPAPPRPPAGAPAALSLWRFNLKPGIHWVPRYHCQWVDRVDVVFTLSYQ